jgi:glutathionyl-hydroquinone reductase
LCADGVYKSGFATSQEAYETAVKALFDSLDRLEKMLNGKDYLIGDRLTEADIRLFVTIVRPFFPPSYPFTPNILSLSKDSF